MQETQVSSLRREDPLKKEMISHITILAWEIPWTEESGGLQSMGRQRVGHNLANEQQQQQSKDWQTFYIKGQVIKLHK